MIKRKCIACVVLIILLSQSAFAHDYWIAPDTFFAQTNKSLVVRLMLGDKFVIEEERPHKQSSTVSFQLYSKEKVTDLTPFAKDGEKPIAIIRPDNNGNHLIAIERSFSYISLEPEKFTAYLKEEGLEEIIVEREKLKETDSPGFERYSRFLKSLIQVGGVNDDIYKTIVGHKLEIVPQENPYTLKRGDKLSVIVLFEGKPLSNSTLHAYNKNGKRIFAEITKTDSDGRATFKLDHSGKWIIRLVNMRRCDNCKNAEWESFWASFTFAMK